MKTSTIITLGAGCASVGLGWFMAGMSNRDTTAGTASGPAPATIVPIAKSASDQPIVFKLLEDDPSKLDFAAISDLMFRLETASIADCRRWLERIVDDESPDSAELKRAIIEHFAELDPAGAWKLVDANEKLQGYSGNVLGIWAKADLEGAVEAAVTAKQQSAIYSLMEAAGPEQIEHLYHLLVDRGFNKGSTGGFFESIFRYLAQGDKRKAAVLALQFDSENSPGYSNGLDNVLAGWVHESPDAALKWVESIENKRQRDSAMAMLAIKWIQKNPQEGLELMWDKVAFEKQQNSSFSISIIKQEEFDKLLTWIGERKDESPTQAAHVLQAMVSGLYVDNLDRLAQIVPMLDGSIKLDRLRYDIPNTVTRWAAQDETAVLEFIDNTTNPTVQEAAIRGLVNHWSKNDPARALEFLGGLDEPIKNIDTNALLNNLFEQSDDLATVFAQIPESMRDQSYLDYAWRMGRNEPAKALEFLKQQPEGEQRNRAMQHAASYLAREDPAAATEWVSSLPEGEDRQYGAANVADSWARYDATAATEWAKNLPDDLSREWALRKITEVISSTRPAEAVELALSIQDKESRARAMNRSLPALARQDPTAALALVETAGFTEAEAKQLTSAANESLALREALAK
ncbi:MAG: hypothetical protein KDN22_12095 [Verrucomicrobiae bacterium]|nr:hypothetical protein [Verrucomicrobiae bacterium]